MIKVYLETLTCDRRGLDANKTRTYLLKNNYLIVNKPKDADIIIFFACAALNSITERSLKKIKKLKKYHANLIVAGCLPEIEEERLSEIFQGRTLSTKDLDKMDQLFPGIVQPFSTIEDANIVFRNRADRTVQGIFRKSIQALPVIDAMYLWIKKDILRFIFGKSVLLYKYLQDTSTYHVRISTGCLGECSYCAIKKGIGSCVSKPVADCLNEFEKGLKQGYTMFILDGDDTGAYGLDIHTRFPELLERITQIPGNYAITISNFQPVWLVKYIDDLERIFQRNKIEGFQCPIQAGSTRILQLMNRYSDTEKIKEALLRVKQSSPQISVITDYILGFPAETEEDFQETLDYIKTINFDGGMVISFSLNTGTKAENIGPKVPQDVMKKRLKAARHSLKHAHYHTLAVNGFKSIIFFKN